MPIVSSPVSLKRLSVAQSLVCAWRMPIAIAAMTPSVITIFSVISPVVLDGKVHVHDYFSDHLALDGEA